MWNVLFLLRWSLIVNANSVILPTIYWDPANPLFACETTIHVELDDVINFRCRDKSASYSQSLDETPIYENAYFLGSNQYMYNTCNATGAKEKILYCNDKSDAINEYAMTFAQYAASDRLTFVSGKTYYIIGTGFRSLDNLDNLINGSCNNIVKEKTQYNLRLKIYVCTSEEISNNTCGKCKYDACYYKDCQVSCTAWQTDFSKLIISSNNSCTSPQTRTCTNQLLGSVTVEQKEINVTCPLLSTPTPIIVSSSPNDFSFNCTSWKTDFSKFITSSNNNCSYPRLRKCTYFENTTVEIEEIPTKCPDPINSPFAASQNGQKNDEEKLKYIAIFISISALLIGIVLGTLIHKHCASCKCPTQVDDKIDCGVENNGFSSDIKMKVDPM